MYHWRAMKSLTAAACAVALGAAVLPAQTRNEIINVVNPSLYSQVYYRPLYAFSRGGRVTAVTGVPSKPAVFYMGAAGGGVWRTTNSGERWEPLTDGQIGVGTIGAVDVSLSNPDVAYVAALGNIFGPNPERGVYLTKDGGKTWTQSLKVSENTGAEDVSMDRKNPDVLFASLWTARRAPRKCDAG